MEALHRGKWGGVKDGCIDDTAPNKYWKMNV